MTTGHSSSPERRRDLSSRFDAVIIGSGLGGLTCGAFLARAGMRVCVLERHSKIGGYAHSFRRGAFTFESGIHSVPMGKGGVIDHLLSLLGVADRITTIELPELYHVQSPAFSFTMPSRQDDIHAALNQAFPHERQNLSRLFAEFKRFDDAIIGTLYSWETNFGDEDREFVSQFHNLSYEQFINRWLQDEKLKQAFFGQWPYGGGSPDFGGALFYAMMFVLHYRDGTHSLKGGFKTLADALAGVITAHGGAVRTRSAVAGIAAENHRVRSVVLDNGEEIEAGLVVSNISPYQLHAHVLPEASRSSRYLRRLSNLRPSVSAFVVYCGLKDSARAILPHDTTFWYASPDSGAIFKKVCRDDHETLDHFICLRSPHETAASTLTMLYFLNKSSSNDWTRDKPAWTERMLAHAERLFPGLGGSIDLVEAGSPATFERYTANTDGALYGFENTKNIYGEAKLPITTHLDNLYQTGHWGKPGGGVLNVMFNGYAAYHTIMKNHSLGVHAPHPQPTERAHLKTNLRFRFVYPHFQKFLENHHELNAHLEKYLVGNYTMPPSLALPIIAALTPPDIEVNLTDDNIGQPIDYDEKVDLAVVSCFTPQASRAYAIADEYRRHGTRVIMGGIHPTALPQEALEHADAVCVGEVEPIWREVLADLRAGSLKKIYQAPVGTYCLDDIPIPRRDIFSRDIYKWNAHLVLTTRGCPVRCSGCPIPDKEGVGLRLRPVENIIADIKQMPYREFYFADDTVMLPGKKNMRFLLSIMERTADLDVSIFLASTMMMVSEPDFYRKLKAGGASSIYTIFGFDRVSKRLFEPDCTPDEWRRGVELVRMIEDAGIHFFASFGIGFDDQDKSVVERILRFSEESGIDLAEFYIPVPFPGTPFGRSAQEEGRILHRNYDLWNHGNIVFKPKNFTQKELMEGFYALWKGFYSGKDHRATIRSFTVTE
jgi:phytoene dehydrogenase-like protein/radical SAM superfamily enzyme YgiQ (UPF0313 family)